MGQSIGNVISKMDYTLRHKSKIVLMALGQPTTNPRLLKEAVWFSEKGYEVHVLYCFWAKWGYESDKKIFTRYPSIKWIEVGGNPYSRKLIYLYTRIRFKIYRLIASRFPMSIYWVERSISRCYFELFRYGRAINASLYIAHNLGALPVVGRITSILNKPFIFDAEDFHRGQSKNGSISFLQAALIENSWMPKARLITVASPLIAEKYKNLLGLESLVINNVFSTHEAPAINSTLRLPVKLFWFSQTIGKGRGIEDLLTALKNFPFGSFTITLMGDLTIEMENYLRKIVVEKNEVKVDLTFLKPVDPDKIFKIATNYDVGLAIEPGINENNDLSYSNKLFTYLLAGNAVLFTSTTAQECFFKAYKNIGWIYPSKDIESLVLVLRQILSHPNEVLSYKQNARLLAKNVFNWEKEQAKLINHLSFINGNA